MNKKFATLDFSHCNSKEQKRGGKLVICFLQLMCGTCNFGTAHMQKLVLSGPHMLATADSNREPNIVIMFS